MADRRPNPDHHGSYEARWADPRIRAIMRPLEDGAFDYRGAFSPRLVTIRQTWNRAAAGFPALLAAEENGRCFTIVTHVELRPGGAVILEKPKPPHDITESLLCTIRDCRPGRRACDHKDAVYISRLLYKIGA